MPADGRTNLPPARRLDLDVGRRDGLERHTPPEPLVPCPIELLQLSLQRPYRVEGVRHARLDQRQAHAPVVRQARRGRVREGVEQQPVVVEDVPEVLPDRRAGHEERLECELRRRQGRREQVGALAEEGVGGADERGCGRPRRTKGAGRGAQGPSAAGLVQGQVDSNDSHCVCWLSWDGLLPLVELLGAVREVDGMVLGGGRWRVGERRATDEADLSVSSGRTARERGRRATGAGWEPDQRQAGRGRDRRG